MDWWWYIPLFLVGGLLALFVVVQVVLFFTIVTVSYFEKQPIKPFVPPPEGEEPELSPYAAAMNEDAEDEGFRPHGTYVHAKGGAYKVTASLWLSPSGNILALVGGGRMIKLRFRKTFLYTRVDEGRCYVTTDEYGEGDLSGVFDYKVVQNADFEELLSWHRKRVAREKENVIPFAPKNVLGQLEDLGQRRAEILIDRGLACWVDDEHTFWRYTLRGSLALYFKSALKQFAHGSNVQHRSGIRRPGD